MAKRGRSRRGRKPQRRVTVGHAARMARRLAVNASLELILAGGQILREEFGFSAEQVNRWTKTTTDRANRNREKATNVQAQDEKGQE